ncbi:acyltransferase family protein [candidate division KSB1 bacterium]|nr:acyltransferase family protein [candidate division KSB1 bacterium]
MENRPRLNTLEGLRFLATLHLFIFHYGRPFFEDSCLFIKSFFGAGYYSTSIFFILSGFILTYVYLDSDGKSLRIKSSCFYLKRIFRLYPFHCLGYCLIIFPLISGASTHNINLWHSIYNLSLIHAWIPNVDIILSFNRVSWSASALLFFYLTFPGLIRLTLRWQKSACLKGILILWLLTLLVSLVPAVFFHNDPTATYIFHFNPLVRLFEFAIGVFAGKLYFLMRKRTTGARSMILVALLNASACALAPVISHVWVLIGMFSLLQVTLIYVLVSNRSFFQTFFSHPVMRLLGQSSIAFYFLHGPLFPYLRKGVQLLQVWKWFEPEESLSGLYSSYRSAFAYSELTLTEFFVIMVLLFCTCILLNRYVSAFSACLFKNLVEKRSFLHIVLPECFGLFGKQNHNSA